MTYAFFFLLPYPAPADATFLVDFFLGAAFLFFIVRWPRIGLPGILLTFI